MKLQYLGDSRDTFKWDYQDFLAHHLGYRKLNFVPMLTPDDASTHGQTDPTRFPGREEIVEFCRALKRHRDLDHVRTLPSVTGADYEVVIHRQNEHLKEESRETYFSGIGGREDQLVFLDPDNGFEPKHGFEKHVRYADIERILDQCTVDSAVSVFQYWRKRKFDQDFAAIRSQLHSGYSAAVYGRYVMFVTVSRSKATIEGTIAANRAYASDKRVATIS